MKKKKFCIKYEAQGFVEALIAILITGIAAIALMQISASTIRNVIDNEVYDQLTYEAVKGAAMVKHVAGYLEERLYDPRFNTLPVDSTRFIDKCYPLLGDIDDPGNPNTEACTYSDLAECAGNSAAKITNTVEALDLVDANIFRVVCYTDESSFGETDQEKDVIVAKIVTGFISSCNVSVDDPDCALYEHTLVFSYPHVSEMPSNVE